MSLVEAVEKGRCQEGSTGRARQRTSQTCVLTLDTQLTFSLGNTFLRQEGHTLAARKAVARCSAVACHVDGSVPLRSAGWSAGPAPGGGLPAWPKHGSPPRWRAPGHSHVSHLRPEGATAAADAPSPRAPTCPEDGPLPRPRALGSRGPAREAHTPPLPTSKHGRGPQSPPGRGPLPSAWCALTRAQREIMNTQ